MTFLVRDVIQKGYIYFDWNVSGEDSAGANSASQVYYNVVNGLSKNRSNIVLLHDMHGSTVEALRDIIRFGKKNGYQFKVITENTSPVHHGLNN